MTNYYRVLPRDLFNEANLLKCIGKIILDIEDSKIDFLQYHHDGEAFNIMQNESNGALYVSNITFWNTHTKKQANFERPLNSREAFPLYMEGKDDTYEVFSDAGEFILNKEAV